mmetsp:Transcript_6273/g.15533  ORF Transcript_6273/g.15533 Transcript_6273/m.15533 type:complete len:93 (-) Transcript_6273:70-348(-)
MILAVTASLSDYTEASEYQLYLLLDYSKRAISSRSLSRQTSSCCQSSKFVTPAAYFIISKCVVISKFLLFSPSVETDGVRTTLLVNLPSFVP